MNTARFLSISDQVAARLRAEIARGRWSTLLPGKHQLAAELGVNNKTVELALRQLEDSGDLVSQGAGRPRRIAEGRERKSRSLRIACLLDRREGEQKPDYWVELYHALLEAGHTMVQVSKSMSELRFDPDRIDKLVNETGADAWIIFAGSRDVLEWFSHQPLPAFALFGHRAGLKLPAVGPDKPPAIAAATRHLIQLGHRRIALLCRKIRRLPTPGTSESAFLGELQANGITAGNYNLPDWVETPAGFQELLESMFQVTPPTALIVDEAPNYVAVLQFLCRRGIRMPADVSLVCTDDDLAFEFCEPPVTRIRWDSRPLIHRLLGWAANVSRHRPDFGQTLTACEFVPGGTTAPCARRPGI